MTVRGKGTGFLQLAGLTAAALLAAALPAAAHPGHGPITGFLGLQDNILGDRLYMAIGITTGNDQIVRNIGKAAHIENRNIHGFHVFQR